MSNKLVRAIRSFDHYGMRKRGAEFTVSRVHAEQLRARGLVIIVGESEQHPIQPAGRTLQSSASPVGQASPLTTSNASESGDSDEESESEADSNSEPKAPREKLKPWQKKKR